ncbi:hypothetical protein L1887_34506 [Cichorium endivia]|nr:hypothetical protein L1887_34506 [Cichorium endivia]
MFEPMLSTILIHLITNGGASNSWDEDEVADSCRQLKSISVIVHVYWFFSLFSNTGEKLSQIPTDQIGWNILKFYKLPASFFFLLEF